MKYKGFFRKGGAGGGDFFFFAFVDPVFGVSTFFSKGVWQLCADHNF